MDNNGKCTQKQNILKKNFLMGLVQMWDHLSLIKWSQNCTRTIRSGVVGIPKYLKNCCKAGDFNIVGCAKNTTFDGPGLILRRLYNRFFCHNTIKKWSQICTRTIRNGFFKDILFLGSFYILIPIVNSISNLDHEWFELSCQFFCGSSVHPKTQ